MFIQKIQNWSRILISREAELKGNTTEAEHDDKDASMTKSTTTGPKKDFNQRPEQQSTNTMTMKQENQ